MRNRTDITRVPPLVRLRELFTANRVLFELAGSAAGGFVLANSFIFGGVSPFGVAFSASLPGKHSQCAALGALLGYVVSSSMLGNMKYIVALVLVVAGKWLLESKLDKPSTPIWNVLAACVAMTLAAATIFFTADYTVYDLLLAVAEISLASGSAYFLSRTLTVLDAGLAGATRADISCAVVSVAVVLMGFSGFRLGSLSVGRILAVILILLCARYGGESAGAVAGITAGIAIGLTGRDYGYVASAYALGGLVAGVFSHGGRLAAAGAFIVVNALTALFISGNVDVYTAVLEIFAASVLFMLIPGRWAKKWKMTALRAGPDGSPQSLLRGRLARRPGRSARSWASWRARGCMIYRCAWPTRSVDIAVAGQPAGNFTTTKPPPR
jgi:stage II sporulation protein E